MGWYVCGMAQICRSEVNVRKLTLSCHLVGLETHTQVVRFDSWHHGPLSLLANFLFLPFLFPLSLCSSDYSGTPSVS